MPVGNHVMKADIPVSVDAVVHVVDLPDLELEIR